MRALGEHTEKFRQFGGQIEQIGDRFDRLSTSLERAASGLDRIAAARAIAGGTPNIGQVGTAGAGAGLSVSESARLGWDLRERLSRDSWAMREMGYEPDPRVALGTDPSVLLNRAIDTIRSATTEEEARLFAIRTGTEALLELRYADQQHIDALRELGRMQDAMNDGAFRAARANERAMRARIDETQQIIDMRQERINQRMRGAALQMELWWTQLQEWASRPLDRLGGGQDRATREHAAAMREHAGALRASNRREIWGGGQRARGAIPGGLRAEALDAAVRERALRLGHIGS